MLKFSSSDGRYRLDLPNYAVEVMLDHAKVAGESETGGILVGRYNDCHDTAIVTRADDPPADSQSGPTWFWRGIRGLNKLLHNRWDSRVQTYYLGEWHYHPFASAEHSPQDEDTMLQGHLQNGFACEAPILIIVGGDPKKLWTLRAWVFIGKHQVVSMLEETAKVYE